MAVCGYWLRRILCKAKQVLKIGVEGGDIVTQEPEHFSGKREQEIMSKNSEEI